MIPASVRTDRRLVVNSEGLLCRTCGELHAFYTVTRYGRCGIPVSFPAGDGFLTDKRTIASPQEDLPRVEDAAAW